MSASRCAWLALGIAFALSAGGILGLGVARAETGADAPSSNAASTLGGSEQALTVNPSIGGDTGLRSTIVDDCAGRVRAGGLRAHVAHTGSFDGGEVPRTEREIV